MSENTLKLKRFILKKIAPAAVSTVVKILFKTIKWQYLGLENIKDIQTPAVFVFFHGRMLMLSMLYRKIRGKKGKLKMILSPHFDGEVAASIIKKFGIEHIYGSSFKQTLQLLRKLSKLEGYDIGITPDGPRGPNEKVKSGVIYIGKIKKYPIIPVVYSVKKFKSLNSWDRFMIPMPFTRGVFMVGEPLLVFDGDGKENLGEYTLILEERMKELRKKADETARNI